jgi:hypothetical protein
MTALVIIIFLIVLFISTALFLQAIKFYGKLKQLSHGDTVKDVRPIKYDNNGLQEEKSFSTNIKPKNEMDWKLYDKIDIYDGLKPNEKRKKSRKGLQTSVEFIKGSVLFKEISRDISYSGIFLKSKTPDKFNINDLITLTFQTSKSHPQKFNGKVVRKDKSGIGVKFLN